MIGFFRLAKSAASFSDCRYKVGAVLCRKKPISVGFNKMRTHPIYNNGKLTLRETLHAEINCIIHSGGVDLTDTIMYIYREDSAGNPALARPCEDCLPVLQSVGIKKIYYTISEPPFYKTERL